MTISHQPSHGFVVECERHPAVASEIVGADMGEAIYVSTNGMYGRMVLTPSEARDLAHALTRWADEKEQA